LRDLREETNREAEGEEKDVYRKKNPLEKEP